MNENVLKLINQFLDEGKRVTKENFVFSRKEMVNYVIVNLAAANDKLLPTLAISEIHKFLLHARDEGLLARIAVGKYEIGGHELPKDASRSLREDGFSRDPAYDRPVVRGTSDRDSGVADPSQNSLEQLIAQEFKDVASLASSSTFLVNKNLSLINLASLKGLSF